MPAAVVATRPGTGPLPALTEGEKAEWLVGRARRRTGKAMGNLQLVLGSPLLSVVGAGRRKNGNSLSQPRLSSPLQMLHLGMQVLMLHCGLQQILAGDLTRGGLLSFLLFQEDVGHYVHVSQKPMHAFLFPLCFSPWPLGLGLYWFPLKTENKTKIPAYCIMKNLKHMQKKKR